MRKCVFLYEEHLVKLVLSCGVEAGNLKLYEKGQGCAARSREVGRLCQSILLTSFSEFTFLLLLTHSNSE